MVKKPISKDEKGQVGIGTLIVFIAMVLVAAIAAAVLINTAGLLQQRATTTGEEATSQTSTGMQVIGASGNVTGSKTVDEVNLTVKLNPGSNDVNMNNTVVSYSDDDTAADLLRNHTATSSSEYTTSAIQDEDNSHPIFNAKGDTFKITIDVSAVRGDTGLGEGEDATFKLVPATGSTTMFTVNVDESLSGMTKVDLT